MRISFKVTEGVLTNVKCFHVQKTNAVILPVSGIALSYLCIK